MATAFVIGLGRVGRNHAEAYRDTDGVELVGVAEVDDERRASLGDAIGVPPERRYADSEAGLAATEPDLVSVATPAEYHPTTVREALAHAAVVWCEKPLATSVATAETLVREADAAGVELVVNHSRRFSETFERLHEWLHAERVLGDLHAARVTTGVELLNLGTHYVDLLLYLLDTRAERVVSGSVTESDGRYVGGGVIETAAGTRAEIAREERPTHRLEITGSDGRLSVPLAVGPDVTPTVELWDADAPGRVAIGDGPTDDGDAERTVDPDALSETWHREATRTPETYEAGYVPAQALFENAVGHLQLLLDDYDNAAPGRRAVHGLDALTAFVVASETGARVELPTATPFRSIPLAFDPADPVRFDPDG